MDKFEYVVALAAVITGLGLSDVAVSLHRLLKRRAGVMWDWLPITFALYASLVLMRLWYQLWSIHELALTTTLSFVGIQVIQTLVLVLVASAALPDEDDFEGGRIDLARYYAQHGRYVWIMYLVFMMMWTATGFGLSLSRGNWTALTNPIHYVFFIVPLGLVAAAPFVVRRWQAVILALLILHEVFLTSDLFRLWRFTD